MSKLLHIISSPRKTRSHSLEISLEFIKSYKKSHPEDDVEILDLWNFDLPDFDEKTINAKYKIIHGIEHDETEAAFWKGIKNIFDAFNSADKYLFSVPMWNFSIPYKLKHFIDLIVQPTLSFKFTEKGYEGLVKNKPATIIYASGGDFSEQPAKELDFQKKYLEHMLNFIGFEDIRAISVAPTMASKESLEKLKKEAAIKAENLAKNF
jgi:FMN-dependent NADH-azoreductase